MTEQEWQVCDDPDRMLKRARFRSYQRKSRLFAVACCRCTWDLLIDERSRAAVEVAERHADGTATDGDLRLAAAAAQEAHREMFAVVGKIGSCLEWAAEYAADPNPFHGAKNVTWMAATPRARVIVVSPDEIRVVPCTVTRRAGPPTPGGGKWEVTTLPTTTPTGAEKHIQAALLRDLFGPLPFRTPRLEACWRTPLVLSLAEAAYQERELPGGQLNRNRLGVLADALEEAAADSELLAHLRQPGPHWRGCWALDCLLARE